MVSTDPKGEGESRKLPAYGEVMERLRGAQTFEVEAEPIKGHAMSDRIEGQWILRDMPVVTSDSKCPPSAEEVWKAAHDSRGNVIYKTEVASVKYGKIIVSTAATAISIGPSWLGKRTTVESRVFGLDFPDSVRAVALNAGPEDERFSEQILFLHVNLLDRARLFLFGIHPVEG